MINADLFKDTFGMYATEIWSMPENDFLKWLNEDAEPNTGHWILDADREHGRCSECGCKEDLVDGHSSYKWCSNCGARMVEKQESERI